MRGAIFAACLLLATGAYPQAFPPDSTSGGGTPTYPLLASDGLGTAPSYSFSGNPDMGFYRSGENVYLQNKVSGVSQSFLRLTTQYLVLESVSTSATGNYSRFQTLWDGADMTAQIIATDGTDTSTTTFDTTETTFTDPVELGTVAFSALGTPGDGTIVYCSDCTKATPCAGSGSGALAKRINGAWDCD